MIKEKFKSGLRGGTAIVSPAAVLDGLAARVAAIHRRSDWGAWLARAALARQRRDSSSEVGAGSAHAGHDVVDGRDDLV